MGGLVCGACGAPSADAEFCDACGAYLGWDGEAAVGSEADAAVVSPSSAISRAAPCAVGGHDHEAESTAVVAVGSAESSSVRSSGDFDTGTAESSQPRCPRCDATNPPHLRFCGRCALPFHGPVFADPIDDSAAPVERAAWWERLFARRPRTRRAARVAYRRSLPLRYRVQRWLWGSIAVGVIAGSLLVLGQNPVGWIGERWADMRGSLTQVEPLRAVSEPPTSVTADSAAFNIVDNHADTAWVGTWSAALAANPSNRTCLSPASGSPEGVAGSVLLVPESVVTVRAVAVAAGLREQDPLRQRQWRPKTLQLAFSDGSCQQILLSDAAELQRLPLDPVATSQVRISVLDAYPPDGDQPIDQVAISEVQLFSRP